MCCIISFFYFPQNATDVIILSFPVQTTIIFFITHTLKFKFQYGQIKVKNINIDFTLEFKMMLYCLTLNMGITSSLSNEHANTQNLQL
jgi:hypothetical protein